MIKRETRGQEVKRIKEKDLDKMLQYLREQNIRMYCLIRIGINIGLRISDLTNLTFEEVVNDEIDIIEKKTGKHRKIKINKTVRSMICLLKTFYRKRGINPCGYLFKSFYRQYNKLKIDKSLTTVSINRFFRNLRNELNIRYPIGTHSLRKTFAHRIYEGEKDIGMIMMLLNHSSEKVTLRYIGIEEEKLCKIYEKYMV